MDRIRLLVVDDHGILRAGLAMLIEAQPDMELAGEAATGDEAVKAVENLQPDVVIMDLAMPEMDGYEATRIIKSRYPKVEVLALSMHDGDDCFFKALEAGAAGFVPKIAAATQLIAAIRAVHRGDVFLYPTMAKALLTKYLGHTPATRGNDDCGGLTAREQEVLRLLADGLLNRDIAERLGVAETTVERHRANVMEKLDLHSRADLIKYAVRKGIVRLEGSGGRSKASAEWAQTGERTQKRRID